MESKPEAKALQPAAMSEALLSELTSWSASSKQDLKVVAETKKELRFSTPPDLKCIVCKEDIKSTPVYQCQTGHLVCYYCSQKGDICPSCSKAISASRMWQLATLSTHWWWPANLQSWAAKK